MYRSLVPEKLHKTITRLHQRIIERFPDSSLGGVCEELSQVSGRAGQRAASIQRPIWGLRFLIGTLILAAGVPLILIPLDMKGAVIDTTLTFVQALESVLATLFFLGALILSLVGLETRLKRKRILDALYELRALAHVVDMHQLTKDPSPLHEGHPTASSPRRDLTPYELTRYYDYCSEILSLIAKLAALYVQDLPDPAATSAVDEVEGLCSSLSRKIWQKTMLVPAS